MPARRTLTRRELTPAALLLAAADDIEGHGLAKGRLRSEEMDTHCVLGALNFATYGSADPPLVIEHFLDGKRGDAVNALRATIRRKDIARWNDHEKQTATVVARALRRAAASLTPVTV